ncbi:EfeM/EfeO family lipoprotein [Streptacidiphilus cavernicola]|uniref:EfeM/EfeO family lipoprotein n=1 Tax=Streptacidiphilus cavernicola TaxID=3342716 RepID=A0ABV6VPT6_9ACTN
MTDPSPRARRLPFRILAAAAVCAAALALLGGAVPASAGPVVTVGEGDCGSGWTPAAAGPQSFQLSDTARDPAEVYLVSADGGEVYAEVLSLLPGVPRTLATALGPGRYALRCVFTDGTVRTSPVRGLTGAVADPVRGIPPLPDLDLAGPVNAYRRYVDAALPGLLAAGRVLDADVRAGDLTRARADWLTAHLDYERLGAAYNSFGDFDAAIDGTADGLPLGTADPSWTGFHRIEYGLWHGQSASVLRVLTHRLVGSVQGMIADFPSADIDPGDLPLRSHEILENALQFQLTGSSDYGSGTALATLRANVQGTVAVLATLTGLIAPRDPGLTGRLDSGLTALDRDLDADRTPAGAWIPPAALTLTQRQRLDSDLGGLLEQLSTVPDLLQGRPNA